MLAACWLASRSARDALRESWFRCGRVTRELPWLMVATFSLVNAAVAEAIFRGVLQTDLERVSDPVLAVVVQAVAFSLLHVVGVPTGISGAIMAGTLGLLLAVMHWRTRVLAPYLAHAAADATIFCMLLPTLR